MKVPTEFEKWLDAKFDAMSDVAWTMLCFAGVGAMGSLVLWLLLYFVFGADAAGVS